MTETIELPQTKARREVLFRGLYLDVFPGVAQYVGRMGGTLEEAKDVFQDAVIQYYEQVVAQAEAQQLSVEAYVFGIARHLWIKRYRQQNKYDRPNGDLLEQMPNPALEEQPSAQRLLHFLEQAGRKCMELLQAFYYHKRSMPELADAFGYTSTRSATVQKYKCLEKVRDHVHQQQLDYADFVE